jgi:DNA-binding transcriptional MerR regulator
VRVYQDRGLLPPPRRQGRIGLYSEQHLSRLKLIGRLLARGYTFAIIGELFSAWHSGQDIAETLGLREALTAPWNTESPIRLSRSEVARRYGISFSKEAADRAIQLGMLVPSGSSYLIPSPSLFEAGAEMVAAGVPLDVVLDLAASVQKDLARVAFRFVDVSLTHIVQAEGQEDVAQRLLRLRPYAQKTVDALLLMAMQRETDRLMERLPAIPVSHSGSAGESARAQA